MAIVRIVNGQEQISGRIGNVIVVNKGGKHYLRSAPKKVKRQNTPMQAIQQQKFGFVNRFLSGLSLFFRMKTWDGSMSSRPPILGHTIKNGVDNGADGLYILYPKISLSSGLLTLPKVKSLVLNKTGGCELKLKGSGLNEQVALVLVMYDPLMNSWKWKAMDYTGSKICYTDMMGQSEVVEAWVFSRMKDGSAHSDSLYLGSVFNV